MPWARSLGALWNLNYHQQRADPRHGPPGCLLDRGSRHPGGGLVCVHVERALPGPAHSDDRAQTQTFRLGPAEPVKLHQYLALGTTVTAVAACYVLYGSDRISGRVTSYYATCLQRSADNRCSAVGRTLDPSVFHVSVALQQVEVLGEHGERLPLRSCAVTSRKDWHCRSATDDAFELGFNAGQPWLRIQGSDATDLIFLPRWRYLWLKSGEPHRDQLPARFLIRR